MDEMNLVFGRYRGICSACKTETNLKDFRKSLGEIQCPFCGSEEKVDFWAPTFGAKCYVDFEDEEETCPQAP